MELYLLKPLDVTCSIAVNIKQEPMQEADGDKLATSVPSCIQSIAFTIHINTSRVDVNICEPQVDLIHQLLNLYLLEFVSNLRSSEPWPSGDHARNGTVDCHLQSDVKLSALVQWTLARMVVNLRTVSSSPSQECRKIALEIQELIVSMDYQPPSYQMIKFKMADAAVHHFKRLNFEDPWSLGDYQGVIMKVNEIESRSSNGKSADEDTSGGFLTITLTRANSDNLHSKIGTRDRVHKFNKYMCIPSVHLNTITEIIIKVQPLDFILAPSTISTFLDILSPLIRSNRGASTRQLVSSKSATYLCAKEDLNRQEFSLNREEFNLKEEELYPEKFNLSQQRLELNEDKTNWKKEEFNSNFEEFSLNSEEFSLNQDQSNAERIGATIKESNSNQRFGAPSDVQTRMSGSRDRSENFLSASVPSPFGTRREGSIDKTPPRKQSGTSQERQIRGSSEPTTRESKYSASWESTPGEHDGQKSVQNIWGERDGRESVEKGRSRYTECSALRMDAKATVPREEGRNEGCDTSLRMDVTSMDVKYDMKTLEEIREMKMDEKQVRLSENAQLGYQSFPRERNQGISHAGKSEGTFENSEENPANLAEFSSETERIFGLEGIPHSFVHTGGKVERPLYVDRPVPSGPIDPGLEAPGATAWGRKTNPPPVVPGKRLRKISSASTIGSSEYAPVHRKVSQEKTGADLSSAKKVTQSLIGADLTSSVERKVSQSMQEERIFSKRFSTQASISESDVLSTELGASHHEPPLYREEISPPKEAETSQIDHFQSETLVRKPKEAPRERSIDPRKISSSILKKTSSSSLGESFATKKVSLDLPTDHRAMSPAKPKVPFVSTARLPLLFLDVKNVRVIIPLEAIESGQAKREKVGGRKVESAGKTNGEADRISGGGSDPSRGGIPTSDPPLSPGGSTSLPLTSECLHDCVIVTLGGISISPQVDNPLCRVECRPDLLGLARKFGVDHVLGSQIEDRQYQLDVGTIGVSSGIWSELERGTLLSHTSELELNAALIWNSGQTPGAAPNTLPLLREFSLIATLAPSIVYLYEAVIVAGTSLEINAAKDIHFSLTLAQLRLLAHLYRQLDSHLFSHLRKHRSKLPRNTAHCTRNFGDTSPVTRNFGDSNSALEGRQSAGMGRTQSNVEVGQSHLGAGQSNVGAGQSHVGVGQSKAGAGHNQVGVGQNTASAGQSSNVPFEMLVTGRSILVDLFDKEDNIRPMACLHLIQPDLLVKTNSLQVQASEHTTVNIYDIKVYMNKSHETPTGYYDNQDSASLAEDTKLDETDADSIEGDKSRLTKLIRDKMERQKRHQEILARDQIPLLETGTVPERKRQENGLCPVLIQVKLERTLVGKRLTGSVQKPVRLVLTEELLTRFHTVRSKINTAIHTSPNPTHCKGDQSTNCSTDTLSRGTKYRRHIEKLKVKLEAYGLSEMTLTTDQMTLIVNHLESDLPSLCLNLSSGLLSLSHPFSSHLHISTLSLSTQLTSTCPPRFLVDPMEVKVGLDCAWESWYPTFLMFLNGNIEYVSVNISAYQLEVLYRIYHQYKHLLPTRHTSNNRGDPTTNSSKDSGNSVPNISSETAHSHVTTAKETASHVATAKETTDFDGATLLTNAAAKVASGFESTATPSAANFDDAAAKGTPSFNAAHVAEPDQDQHYVDDLRAGAFQYIPVPDTSTRLPLSYQILYNAYSITWKYPSPRSITRIYIAPVPSLEETPNQADYLLQYYDSSKGFTVYARLKVVENSDEVAKVDFFDVPPLKPVSEVWRIVHEDHVNEDLDLGRDLTEARSVGIRGKAEISLSRGNEGLSGVSGVEMDGNVSGKTPRQDGSKDDVQGTNNDSEDRRAHHCNMQLLLGSIRVDSFYSYKLISNLHINLDNKVFKLNLLHSGNNGMRYILNKKKLLFRKFKLNEQNAQLFSDDYTIAQFGCTNNRLKYDLNVNFAAGLYLTRVQTGSMAVSLINYNLLTLKPVLEVIQVNANLYNGEYNSKKHTDDGGINIDLIISDHIKCNMSNDFVTSASVVRKVIHRTLNQMKAVTFQSQKDREERLRDANVGEVNGLRSVGDGKHNEESAGQKQSLRPTQANSEIPESNIPIPREQKTDIDLTKAFDSSDTTEAEPSRTKPIQKLKTGHKDLLAGSETSGLPVLDLDDLSDPLYGGSTSGFQSVTQEHICRHCPNCADWKVDDSEHRREAVDPNNTGTIEAEKGTLPVMPEPTEAGMLNDGEVDVDIMLTSVMICNNTHIPFIVRQYDTTRESVVYSMECVYFSWFKSPSPNTSRQHWLEFNIKSADFQWSSPLALNAETKGQHPLYVRGPNGKLFPIVVEVGDCDNAKVVTIHGNLHCANLFNRDLHFLLLCHGGENQLVQVPAKTVSPSVILSPVADISKYEMKIKIQDSVWSGTIPIGANMSAKLGSGEDLWLVKLPLPSSSPSSFESVWVRLLWDHRDTSSADLYRCVFVVTSLYMIRSYLPSPSLIRVTSRRDSAQCVPGKGQLAELNIPNCTSQDTHQVCFQLTQSTKVTTPALQVSYKTVEHNAPPYSELTAQSALDILYNYQLELPGGEENSPCAQTDTLIDQITRRIVPEYMDTPSVLSFISQSNLGSSETSSSLGNGRSSSQSPPSNIEKSSNNHQLQIPPSNIEKSSNNHQIPPSIGGKYHQIPPSASEKSSNPKTSLPPLNIWESSLEGIRHLWPFPTHYTTARPTDTVTHIDIQYTPVPLYNHCLCVTLKPWALLFNSLPVEIALRRDSSDAGPDSCSREESSSSPTRGNLWRGATLSPRRTPASRDPMLCSRERSSPAQHSVFPDPPREASSSRGENFFPDASILCSLDRHSVLSPPRLDSSFWVCLLLRGRRFQSTCSLELRSSQAFYTPKVSGLLFPNSFVYVDVLCEEYMAYITLTSSEFDNIRVLNLQPVYSAANHSSYPLDVQGFVVYPGSLTDPESRDRFQIPHHYPEVLRLQPGQRSGGRNEPRPLLFWKILGPYAPDETPEFYLIFWMNGIPLCPVLLSTLDVKRAHPLCISNQGSPIGLTLTTSVQNGVHQFLVWDNDLPQLVLNNRTDMSLSISPCYADPKKVPPMAFLWKWYMNPRSVSYYSLPEDHTPDSVSSAEVDLPPLMLELEDPTSGSMSSELLVLTECSGRLVHLASTDFKVNIVKEVHSRVVTIEMASSGEISAMDIRKRLALAFTSEERRPLSNNPEVKDSAPATTVTRDSANSNTAHQDSAYSLIASQNAANSNTAQQDSAYSITAIRDSANSSPAQRIVSETLDVTRTPEHSQSFSPGQNPFNASRSITAQRSQGESYFLYLLHSYNFHLKMYVHNAHCRFLEDVQQAALMVVNLDKVLVAMKNGHYKRQASAGYKFTETSVVVNNIQVDNTLYKYGKYDFNVILFKNISNSNASRVNYSELFETTVAQLKRLNSVNFHSTPRLYLLDLIRVHINTPFILRIEDVYLSRLNAYWKRLLRLKLSPPSEESGDPAHNPALPLATTAGYELAFPLRIGTISIEAFTLSLCLHTSSRFYIALDNSPLSFARFERNALVTSSYRLGQAISLHYFLNAIYATGWAIGRLEFCGTPGGLARSVGTGIRDFLTLPYQALGSGPTGFILGLYHGSGSLLRHTAGGTLTSVIKAAASWSRTLDRLTLDEEDLQHTEEIRRRRPVNLTQGLMQGLTEFGISILGAIGGLAYHPIQYAVSGPGSNTTLATSLGKSVMGVISRPLSGAAELVALTGEGFLSTVGWTSIPQLRPELSSLTHELSPLKFPLPSPILYLAEATLYTPADSPTLYRHVCLVITPSDVTLIREDNGDVIDSMGVGGVRWGCDKEDDTRLVLAIQTDTEVHSFAKSRVLSYVQSTTSELFPTTPPSHSTNHSAEFSTNEITSSISGTVSEGHVLFLDPTLKRTVCNVLETLKMLLELRN
ncbi:hypothetical protein M8J75_011905 [Diaphorina citri]|nr:hypothetical protein M8J75_011905 [Diaphorina citri]